MPARTEASRTSPPCWGVPAVAVRPADDAPADRDLRLASYFLGRPPFGDLAAVTDAASARAALARTLEQTAAGAALTLS